MGSTLCKSFACSPTSCQEKCLLANFRVLIIGMPITILKLLLFVRYIQSISWCRVPLFAHNTDYMCSHPPVRLLPDICRWSGEVLGCSPAYLGFGVLLSESLFGPLRPYSNNDGVLLDNLQFKQSRGEYSIAQNPQAKARWKDTDERLSDVSIHPSLALENGR